MTRKKLASLILLVGLVFVGAKFFAAGDRLVSFSVVYLVPPGTTRLEVEAVAPGGGAPLARFVSQPAAGADPGAVVEVHQRARLPPGPRELVITVTGPGGEKTERRSILAAADTEVRIDLTPRR